MNNCLIKYGLMLALTLTITVSVVSAVTIDGNPGEWGPAGFLTGNWSYDYNNANNNVTWVPNDGVKFIVEDNRNPKYPLTSGDPSLVPYIGVHIKGTGSNYVFYDEPQVTKNDGDVVVEPYGYEPYDNEGMYFQQDTDFVYILIVTSVPQERVGDEAPGDLRININKSIDSGDGYPYEMGIKLGTNTGLEQFGIYSVSKWAGIPNYVPANLPARIVAGTKIGTVSAVYSQCTTCNLDTGKDYGEPIYIIELKIPKSVIGATDADIGDFSLNDNCTNDHLISVPEFAVVAIPIAGLFGLVYVLITRRKEH